MNLVDCEFYVIQGGRVPISDQCTHMFQNRQHEWTGGSLQTARARDSYSAKTMGISQSTASPPLHLSISDRFCKVGL